MWNVTCPYESTFVLSKAIKPKYWLFRDLIKIPKKYQYNLSTEALVIGTKLYAQTTNGERLIKNTKNLGKPKLWVLNGQSIYNAAIHHTVRRKIADHYHNVFTHYIEKAKLTIDIPEDKALKLSIDIYEINKGIMPDIDNLWPLEKWFTDSLVNAGVIPDDSPKYVRSSGEKTYNWVNTEDERKLVFTIQVI